MKVITAEGEIIPKFYYGLAYRDWASFRAIWYPIPINYLIRLGRWIEYRWNIFRSKKSWIDNKILEALHTNDAEWSKRVHEIWEEKETYKILFEIESKGNNGKK